MSFPRKGGRFWTGFCVLLMGHLIHIILSMFETGKQRILLPLYLVLRYRFDTVRPICYNTRKINYEKQERRYIDYWRNHTSH